MSLHVGQSHHITVPTDFLHPPIRCRDLTRIRSGYYPTKLFGLTEFGWVHLKTAVGRKNPEAPAVWHMLRLQGRYHHTHSIGAALSVDVLKNSLVQTQLQAGLIKHFSLIGVPSNEAIHFHSFTLAYPVTSGLGLGRKEGHTHHVTRYNGSGPTNREMLKFHVVWVVRSWSYDSSDRIHQNASCSFKVTYFITCYLLSDHCVLG